MDFTARAIFTPASGRRVRVTIDDVRTYGDADLLKRWQAAGGMLTLKGLKGEDGDRNFTVTGNAALDAGTVPDVVRSCSNSGRFAGADARTEPSSFTGFSSNRIGQSRFGYEPGLVLWWSRKNRMVATDPTAGALTISVSTGALA